MNCMFYNGYLAFATTSVRNTFLVLTLIMVSSSFSMIVDELYRYNTTNQQFENFSLFFFFSFIFLCFCFLYNLRNSNYKDINYEHASDNEFIR